MKFPIFSEIPAWNFDHFQFAAAEIFWVFLPNEEIFILEFRIPEDFPNSQGFSEFQRGKKKQKKEELCK